MKELVILGASGHGREVADALRARAAVDAEWALPVSFLDDAEAFRGMFVGGIPVRGGLRTVIDQAGALLGVGYPEMKFQCLRSIDVDRYQWPTLIHPSAIIGSRVTAGRGAFVQAGCVLTCDIQLGDFVTLNTSVSLNHDVSLSAFSTCSPGARVGGRVEIGEGAFIGIGASIRQGIRIGSWSVVGAGAVVVSDVPPNAVVAGVPARIVEERNDGWHRGQ